MIPSSLFNCKVYLVSQKWCVNTPDPWSFYIFGRNKNVQSKYSISLLRANICLERIELYVYRQVNWQDQKLLENPTVMGLDPKIEYIPLSIRKKNPCKTCGNGFKAAAESILEFNKRLIDAVSDIIPAIKPQLAYYEMYGTEGRS